MGLPLALKAHTEGNLELAKEQYERTLRHNCTDPIIYQNFGSLLKSIGEFDYSEKIYLDGLRLYPNHIGILTNLANLYRKIKPVCALQKYKTVISLYLNQGISPSDNKVKTIFIDLVGVFSDLGLTHLTLLLIVRALDLYPDDPVLLLNLMLLLESDDFSHKYSLVTAGLRLQLESYLDSVDSFVRLQILFGLATHELNKSNSLAANVYFDRAFICAQQLISSGSSHADNARKLLTVHSWNVSCTILKFQDFKRGWQLFEYGLQTPCQGKQRWQRALSKPFSSSQLSLWRGECLKDKSLLLLEEQAVGDVMMFASLLHSILLEARSVSLFLSDRLLDIYRRTYKSELISGKLSIFSKDDYHSGRLSSEMFDYQSPLGSICQYRFTSPTDYSPRVPCLIPDINLSTDLASRYKNATNNDKLIGISWRGGGKGTRIAQKSIPESLFFELLSSLNGYRFLSLQYGNCQNVISNWQQKGLNITYDSSINPLKDMDSWLSQVATCDAVLSVANTTIHGSGGLNIPTLCLLSRHADWRWLNDQSVTRSYWYPSVGIARESSSVGWSPAFEIASNWFSAGCPYPHGPSHL